MGAAMAPIGGRARLAGAALLVLLVLPVREGAAQKPDERFTPTPAPTVALPRLTPSGGARAEGLAPGTALQPPPVVAPPLSPVRVPGMPPQPHSGGAQPAPAGPAPARPAPAKPLPVPAPDQSSAIMAKPAEPPAVAPPPSAAEPAPEAPPTAPPVPRRAVVTTADVNLRAAPSSNARVVDELERGERLEAIGPAADGWVRVGRNGKALGYVAADYLADAKAATGGSRPALGRYAKASREDSGCALPDDVPAGKRRAPLPIGAAARVLADANLRVAPACDAKVADVLESGERVTVLDASGSWYRVGRNGRALGYVGAALLGPAKDR